MRVATEVRERNWKLSSMAGLPRTHEWDDLECTFLPRDDETLIVGWTCNDTGIKAKAIGVLTAGRATPSTPQA